uniref:Uncharacterized protein n=1 Tax=Plectus sambesii TaxID=2011161 RepID=A0A914UH06_9BILA
MKLHSRSSALRNGGGKACAVVSRGLSLPSSATVVKLQRPSSSATPDRAAAAATSENESSKTIYMDRFSTALRDGSASAYPCDKMRSRLYPLTGPVVHQIARARYGIIRKVLAVIK